MSRITDKVRGLFKDGPRRKVVKDIPPALWEAEANIVESISFVKGGSIDKPFFEGVSTAPKGMVRIDLIKLAYQFAVMICASRGRSRHIPDWKLISMGSVKIYADPTEEYRLFVRALASDLSTSKGKPIHEILIGYCVVCQGDEVIAEFEDLLIRESVNSH